MILACHHLSKSYGRGRTAQQAVVDVSLAFSAKECCLLLGPSGSGKTTLLSILGCILSPSRGELFLDGRKVDHTRKGMLARLRREYIGFVFQQAQLLPFLTVHQNLAVVGRNSGMTEPVLKRRIGEFLERLGVIGLRDKRPLELSGGERQRVAIARALLHSPRLILADEPTASLDWSNGQIVVDMLTSQAKAAGALLITVTHDTRLVEKFDRTVYLDSGRIVSA